MGSLDRHRRLTQLVHEVVHELSPPMNEEAQMMLTMKDFGLVMEDERLTHFLESICVDKEQVVDIFNLMEHDKEDCISVEQVVQGILTTRGDAQGSELLKLTHDVKRLLRKVDRVSHNLQVFAPIS